MPGRAVNVASWFAAESGQRVVFATQHLHGGMGADISYPIHRYFLWGKQIELLLGSPSAQLARLGRQVGGGPGHRGGAGMSRAIIEHDFRETTRTLDEVHGGRRTARARRPPDPDADRVHRPRLP